MGNTYNKRVHRQLAAEAEYEWKKKHPLTAEKAAELTRKSKEARDAMKPGWVKYYTKLLGFEIKAGNGDGAYAGMLRNHIKINGG